MTYKLLMDTTQPVLMIALAKDADIIIRRQDDQQASHRYHSAILLPQIHAILTEAGILPHDLSGIAVNSGPGSFTGIRTGLSIARLMGQFLNLKTYSFGAFELIAAHPGMRGKTVGIYLNAFRQQHYYAALRVDTMARIEWLFPPQVRNNTEPLLPGSDVMVIDDSLMGKVSIDADTGRPLSTLDLFSPDAMMFYLQHSPQVFLHPWAEILPLYLQLPNITMAKNNTFGLS